MKEIQIKKAVDSKKQEETKDKSSESPKVETYGPVDTKSDSKTLILGVVLVIGIFVLAFVGFNIYNTYFAGVDVVNVDDLHQMNLAGDLDPEEGYIYNGFSFVKADGLWWTDIYKNINGQETIVKVPLHFSPNELGSVEYGGTVSRDFNKYLELFIVINPDLADQYYTLALSELTFNIAKGIERRPVGACSKENPACDEREIISCDNNPKKLPLVELVLDYSVESKIELEGSCIIITGNGYGLVKAVDRLLLTWYKVMV